MFCLGWIYERQCLSIQRWKKGAFNVPADCMAFLSEIKLNQKKACVFVCVCWPKPLNRIVCFTRLNTEFWSQTHKHNCKSVKQFSTSWSQSKLFSQVPLPELHLVTTHFQHIDVFPKFHSQSLHSWTVRFQNHLQDYYAKICALHPTLPLCVKSFIVIWYVFHSLQCHYMRNVRHMKQR